MNWKPKQGEMITVWNKTNDKIEREFIATTKNGKYICYTNHGTNVHTWNYAEPIKKEVKTVAKYRYILNSRWCETRSFYETAEEAERAENAECIEIPNTRIEV